MQKIVPCLWFNDQAEEAVNFYTSLFKNSKTMTAVRYDENGAKVSGRPAGSVMTVTFQLNGFEFMALNGGPIFTFTPAVSFAVTCETEEQIDMLWAKLSEGGKTLMELMAYPFSKKYGWLQDKYGVSWQLNLTGTATKISPFLMYVGKNFGKAEEAVNFYCSILKNSKMLEVYRAGAGEPEPEGTISHSVFQLEGQEFMASESSLQHKFTFTEATSFIINCEDQAEIDDLWAKFGEGGDPNAQQCGWLKDKYGVSWQIVPRALGEIMDSPGATAQQKSAATEALFKMKKIDIKTLQEAVNR